MSDELTFTFTPAQAASASRALRVAYAVLSDEYEANPSITREMCRKFGNTTPEAELANQKHVATILQVRVEETTGGKVRLAVGDDGDTPVPGQSIVSDGLASQV